MLHNKICAPFLAENRHFKNGWCPGHFFVKMCSGERANAFKSTAFKKGHITMSKNAINTAALFRTNQVHRFAIDTFRVY